VEKYGILIEGFKHKDTRDIFHVILSCTVQFNDHYIESTVNLVLKYYLLFVEERVYGLCVCFNKIFKTVSTILKITYTLKKNLLNFNKYLVKDY